MPTAAVLNAARPAPVDPHLHHATPAGVRGRAILIFGLVAVGGCASDCTNRVIASADDPRGRLRAILFNRDCGATTGLSTQISILAKGERLSGAGNAFRADDDHGAAALGRWGGPWADIRWLAPDRLHVRYAAGSRIFEQRDTLAGVEIGYTRVRR